MKKFNIKEVRTHMGLFDFAIVTVVGEYDQAAKYCAWKFESPDYEQFAIDSNLGYIPRGKTFFRTGYVPVIWIPDVPKTAREHATFSHECLHAVMHMLEWAAVPISADTEEVLCHSMAHVINNTLEKLEKMK